MTVVVVLVGGRRGGKATFAKNSRAEKILWEESQKKLLVSAVGQKLVKRNDR